MHKKIIALLGLTLFASVGARAKTLATADVDVYTHPWQYIWIERARELGLVKDIPTSYKPLNRYQFSRAVLEIYANSKDSSEAAFLFSRLYPYYEQTLSDMGLKTDLPSSEKFLKPLDEVFGSLAFSSDREKLPLSEGKTLKKGLNFEYMLSSAVRPTRSLLIYTRLRWLNEKLYLNRLYATYAFKGHKIEIGRNEVWWGTSSTGDLLFSNNARARWMLQASSLQFHSPSKFLGDFAESFQFSLLEKERPRVRAKVIGAKVSWRPPIKADLVLSAERAVQYGGAGRPDYTSLKDWWDIITAKYENSAGVGYHDTNQFALFSVTLYTPWLSKLSFQPFKGGRLYYVYAGDDKLNRLLPTAAAHIYSASATTGKTDVEIGYVETVDSSDYWYTHKIYPMGYTYHGFVIGYPDGGEVRRVYANLEHDFETWGFWASLSSLKRGIYVASNPERAVDISLKAYKLFKYLRTPIFKRNLGLLEGGIWFERKLSGQGENIFGVSLSSRVSF